MNSIDNNFEPKKIGVLGTGTWGIALCRLLANKGHEVTAWSAIESEIDTLNTSGIHPNLPKMEIPKSIVFTKVMEDAVNDKDLILFAVPSVFIRSTAKSVAGILKESYNGRIDQITELPIIVTVAKGIELSSLMTMSSVIKDEFSKTLSLDSDADKELINSKIAALSGPTHAEEVAFDLPTAIVSASENKETANGVQSIFMTPNFRVYTNKDIEGVEICGAMKNVIALTVGISKGVGFGDNAKAALITRGMEEIRRLGKAMGCDERTFSGLAGIGDLIVTATSEHSRNNRCGQLIGEGYSPDEAVKKVGMVVEGLNALPSVIRLGEEYSVETPISTMLDAIVNKGKNPKEAARALMERDKKMEF